MPAGLLTLVEASKCGEDMKKRGVVETIIRESGFLEQIPWKTVSGPAWRTYKEGTLPTPEFRRVNESYNKSWGSDEEIFWGTAIMGGEFEIDNYLVNVTANEKDIWADNWRKFAKATAMRFDHTLINGTGTAKDFKGVQLLVDEGHGQKLLQAAGGGPLTLAKLDEANDLLLNTGGADALWMNRTVRRKITELSRTTVTGISLIDVGTDVFGKQVFSWNDIPIRTPGKVINASNAVVDALPFTEDPGDAVLDTTSIYFVKLDTDNVYGIMGAGGSFNVQNFGETEAAPRRLGRLEWYPGLVVESPYSIVRLYGITNA
jgi:hypothetical protein